MEYIVLNTNHEYEMKIKEHTAYLIEDQWDDWFQYNTMYDLWIIFNKEKRYIGKVKIGQHNMKEYQHRPDIPMKFNNLSSKFFSLGQSDYYYEKIKNLSDDIRKEVLSDLNDIAYNEEIFSKYGQEHVMRVSLLRDFSEKTIKEQFRRIANGGARLERFSFSYNGAINEDIEIKPIELSFKVVPHTKPPTNIHVIIGRNGVGKTHLIRNMIRSIAYLNEDKRYGEFNTNKNEIDIFSKIIFVSFSVFDQILDLTDTKIPYIRIGLPKEGDKITLREMFIRNLKACLFGYKKELLMNSLKVLKADPIFNESGIIELCDESVLIDKFSEEEFKKNGLNIFDKLSSGHKIIIITLVTLIQNVEEKTIIFLDEPECYLHPPLLSSFIRVLSELLIDRNGVAIVATHSPVILQEVPKKCVWKVRRNGLISIAERLEIESFGEGIESLMSEVFGLEVTHSGYHSFLKKAIEDMDDYEEILEDFNYQLGNEAKAILKTLLLVKKNEEN